MDERAALHRLRSTIRCRAQERARCLFHSIHGTLNHLILGDRIWLGRFKQVQFKVPNLDHELYADYQELRVQRTRTDDELAAWVDSLTDEALQAPFEFKSFVNPKSHRCPLWVAVAHLFNHQTHHRGQLTTPVESMRRKLRRHRPHLAAGSSAARPRQRFLMVTPNRQSRESDN